MIEYLQLLFADDHSFDLPDELFSFPAVHSPGVDFKIAQFVFHTPILLLPPLFLQEKKENRHHKIMHVHNFVMIGFDGVDRFYVRVYFGNSQTMAEVINESVSVNFLSNHFKGTAYPWVIFWRGRQYTITKVGLHHITRDGRTMLHIFSVTDNTTLFKLQFDSETLFWKLLEIESQG